MARNQPDDIHQLPFPAAGGAVPCASFFVPSKRPRCRSHHAPPSGPDPFTAELTANQARARSNSMSHGSIGSLLPSDFSLVQHLQRPTSHSNHGIRQPVPQYIPYQHTVLRSAITHSDFAVRCLATNTVWTMKGRSSEGSEAGRRDQQGSGTAISPSIVPEFPWLCLMVSNRPLRTNVEETRDEN